MNKQKFETICALIKLIINNKKSIDDLEDALSHLKTDENINAKHVINFELCTLLEYTLDSYLFYAHDQDKTKQAIGVMKKLLEHRADPNSYGRYLPLLLQIVGYPITSESTIYKESTKSVSLAEKLYNLRNKYIAAMLDLIDLLYQFKANFNVRDKAGNNALDIAAKKGKDDLIEKLHACGCGPAEIKKEELVNIETFKDEKPSLQEWSLFAAPKSLELPMEKSVAEVIGQIIAKIKQVCLIKNENSEKQFFENMDKLVEICKAENIPLEKDKIKLHVKYAQETYSTYFDKYLSQKPADFIDVLHKKQTSAIISL